MKVCSRPGCPTITAGGRCDTCTKQAERGRSDHALRGGGNRASWRNARRACLQRDPVCTCTDEAHGHGVRCYGASTVADHYPDSKRELIEQGITDTDALDRLRGICASCHGKHTAETSPGGWNDR